MNSGLVKDQVGCTWYLVFYGKEDQNLVTMVAHRGLIAAGCIVFSYNGLAGQWQEYRMN